jgi:hypothetical protein
MPQVRQPPVIGYCLVHHSPLAARDFSSTKSHHNYGGHFCDRSLGGITTRVVKCGGKPNNPLVRF